MLDPNENPDEECPDCDADYTASLREECDDVYDEYEQGSEDE